MGYGKTQERVKKDHGRSTSAIFAIKSRRDGGRWMTITDGCVKKKRAHLNPQSSHSKSGFQPNRFPHRSHFALNAPRPPEKKKKSNGLHAGGGVVDVGELTVLKLWLVAGAGVELLRLLPGLMSVNRWCMADGEADMLDDAVVGS